MSVVNISLPSDLLKKVDKYKKITDENRSEFFKNAAELYFKKVEEEIAYRKRLKAIKDLMKIGEEIKKEGVFKDGMYLNGAYVDVFTFGILKDQWQNEDINEYN